MQTETKTFEIKDQALAILTQMRSVVVGKEQALLSVLATMLAGGHILLEDIPGVGKTTMAVAFSKVLGLGYNRVQFTPDVLPSDVTGYSIPDSVTGQLRYQPGAVLCNLFLADELNRATSRTQSALLEAMEEGQVTVDGVAHVIPKPFMVIATQNPTGAAGTQMLPDSQMDRFMIRLSLGYPEPESEKQMVLARRGQNPMAQLSAVMTAENLLMLQQQVANTHVSEIVVDYAVRLISATREHDQLLRGASPRATLAVVSLSQALAQLHGRDYVVPRDVEESFLMAVGHRLLLTTGAQSSGVSADDILAQIVDCVPAPKLK